MQEESALATNERGFTMRFSGYHLLLLFHSGFRFRAIDWTSKENFGHLADVADGYGKDLLTDFQQVIFDAVMYMLAKQELEKMGAILQSLLGIRSHRLR